MTETERKATSSRIQLAFMIDSELTKEEVRCFVEKARDMVEKKDRDRIEFTPPMKVTAPLPSFAFVAGVASFAVLLVEYLVEGYKGGVILDLREKSAVMRRDPHLPRRNIRVLANDGADQIKTSSLPRSTLDCLMAGILSLPQSMGAGRVRKRDVEGVVTRAKTEPARARKVEAETVTS